jgi:hypothetical protein
MPLPLQLKADYLSDSDFNPDLVRGTSVAAYDLCLWVRGIVQYYDAVQYARTARTGDDFDVAGAAAGGASDAH